MKTVLHFSCNLTCRIVGLCSEDLCRMHIQSLHPAFFPPKLHSSLLYTKAQSSEDSCSVFLFRLKQPHARMCFSNSWLLWNALQPAALQSFSAIIPKSPNNLQLVCTDSEIIPVFGGFFSYLLTACQKRYGWSRMFAIVYSLRQLLYLLSMCLQGNGSHKFCIFSTNSSQKSFLKAIPVFELVASVFTKGSLGCWGPSCYKVFFLYWLSLHRVLSSKSPLP